MRLTLLTLTALAAPTFAFAAPDCGNPPVKTTEVAYTIQTPEQFTAPVAIAPAAVTTEPELREMPRTETLTPDAIPTPSPVVVQSVQSATPAVPVFEPSVQLAEPVQAYADLLQRRISPGEGGLNLFDYEGANAAGDINGITAYANHLASQNPDVFSEPDQIAYWANLYNALTLKVILENYPVSSIRKIKSGAFSIGPWKRDAITVNGVVTSLDTIEHKILRKRYENPALVHYMVNCASIGCPNLSNKLWVGTTLDADREQAARDFINSPRGVKIKNGKLKASSIYNWFKEDFGGSKSATLDHFRKYAGPELKAALDAGATIDGYDYDWSLNE